ncbi:CBS domain-containing protein [Tenacibaculum jejuense]|uniref:CBS domain containing membrane protein n=1 Tax=Tenacibaculum jejuense TaxID=584609 RepID=A0A238U5M0_9FLAO|nr:CBS domain-containing protein [Tenacibaculum jejuense]SNR14511.1 CBS domain containing membrane protein [Tenacibaculum jejuense]
MKKRTPVSKIMSANLVTLSSIDDLTTAEELFKTHEIRHIPVVQGEEIIGMLSHTDLLRVSYAETVQEYETEVDIVLNSIFTIEQVMTKNVVTVNASDTIKEVAEVLSTREFHALPVVENNVLVGIVTTTDLIKYLLEQY